MDKFLDTYDHLKLNEEDINHLNRTCNEIEAAIKSVPNKKGSGTERLPAKFCQTFKEELKFKLLLKLFHEMEMEGTLLNSFYEASIIFIPKLDKDISKKENYKSISLNPQ
jgi:hypothetical protein